MTTNFTTLEQSVYDALVQNAAETTGGDFACAEEVNTRALKITKQQFGALLTTLQEKGAISVHITYINQSITRWGRRTRGTKVTQVLFYKS